MRKTFVVFLLFMFWAGFVGAGDVNLTWDASATAAGYRMYVGTSSGVYGPPTETTNTNGSLPGLSDGCVEHFTAVTAFNAAGESGFSSEVQFIPRPIVTGVNEIGNLLVLGTNFGPAVTVEVDGIPVAPLSATCTILELPPQSWLAIQLCNGPVCMTHALGPPLPPTNVEIN